MGSSTPEPPPPKITAEEMSAARLPMAYRDGCAGLLIPLNKCRRESWYAPWSCQEERHSYEKCQYNDFMERVARLDELKKENPGQRFN
jgi:hypothetical protein